MESIVGDFRLRMDDTPIPEEGGGTYLVYPNKPTANSGKFTLYADRRSPLIRADEDHASTLLGLLQIAVPRHVPH